MLKRFSAAQVRKFLVALTGFAVLVAAQFGLVVPDVVSEDVGAIIDAGLGLLTAFGVFAVPNAPATPAQGAAVPPASGPVA